MWTSQTEVQKLVHTFDKDENNAIDVDELQEILEATHKGSVKPEVTQWVMGQSDLNGNGTLSRLICNERDIMVGHVGVRPGILCFFCTWIMERPRIMMEHDQ